LDLLDNFGYCFFPRGVFEIFHFSHSPCEVWDLVSICYGNQIKHKHI
jgi:hypothetical protein